ncbi:uncharacterized protein zgc:113293 [Triplophysa dalaica]|uniref:uncharacterized protein zgc:113293 n=1 Tax=Triplophysa dalaica TaxID=1582913 RepID=UPI0024DF6065|nr:uncharacterized protein zgc:113293 [Triplophysa dalaica]
MLLNAFHLHFLFMSGLFGAATDNIKTLSVMVGGSVTLHTDIEAIERNDHISWLFGSDSPGTRIAEIIKWSYMFSIYVCHKELFGDQLQLNHHTGSLTIKNISTEHSGLYKLTIINKRKTSYRRFCIKVYAPLAVPVITNDSTHNSRASERSSGSECVLLCSVRNISWGTLSFYKGNDLLSNISGSDPSTILSLSLEVEHYDKNLYSCVVNNFITNQTTQINITDLCQPHSEISLLYCLVLLLLIPLAVAGTVWILCAHRKHRKAEQQADENC